MNIRLNKSTFNSLLSSNNSKIKSSNIAYFQLDDGHTISSKEINILPNAYKKNVENIFSKVTSLAQIRKEIKTEGANSITFKTQGDKLLYRLDGKRQYKSLQDHRVQKAFQKVAKDIAKYLKNVGIKKKNQSFSRADNKIIATRPFNAKIIASNEKKAVREKLSAVSASISIYINKLFKTDSEWALWAIWFSDLKTSLVKILQMLGTNMYSVFKKLGVDISKLPRIVQGWDDWLGYLVGGIGIYNGIQILKNSNKIDDTEGKNDGIHKIIRNTVAFIGATIDWIGKALPVIGYMLAKAVLTVVSSAIFAMVTIYAMTKNSYLEYKALRFKSKLNSYLKNDNLTEEQKRIATLKFLKNKLRVSKNKSFKIIKEIREKNPDLSDLEVQKLAHEKIKKIICTKEKRFKRRVGSKIGAVIQDNIKEILKDPNSISNIEKINLIFNKVKDKNAITIHQNKWYMIAALLQGVDIVLYVLLASTVVGPYLLIPGILCTLIFVILTAESFYRTYVKKVDRDIQKDESGKRNIHPILSAV